MLAQLSKSYFFNSPFSRSVQCEVNEKTSTGIVDTGSQTLSSYMMKHSGINSGVNLAQKIWTFEKTHWF